MLKSNESHARSLIYNSLLLTLAAVLMRAVGVAFSVTVSNKVGAEVMGLYSLCTSVWVFAVTLATSGINLATTRTVAEALGYGEKDGGGTVRAALRRALSYAVFFGISASFLMIVLAKPIGLKILSDPRTVKPLIWLGVSLPAISISSALSGYFAAVRRVWKSAAVSVSEQAVKIYCVTVLLNSFLSLGPEWCCTALVMGGAISEIFSCVAGFLLYKLDLFKHIAKGRSKLSLKETTNNLLSSALPVAFSSYIRSALTTIEHILIPAGIEKFGASRGAALAEYGMLNAMVLPVVMFPYAMIHSFTGMLVPELTAAASQKQNKRISYIAGRVWRLTIIFGTAAAGIFICFANEFGMVLYKNTDAAKLIKLLGPLMPIMYLDTVTDSMLKGLGKQVYTMNVNIADVCISLFLVCILIPEFGLNGYIAVLYISEIVNFSLSAAKLLKVSHIKLNVYCWILAPVVGIIIATGTVKTLLGFIPENIFPENAIPAWVALVFHVFLTLLVFLLILRSFGCIDSEMSKWLVASFKIKKKQKGDVKNEKLFTSR